MIGDPISHTLSPAMHNLALAHHGLNMRYLPFHITPKDLSYAIQGFRAMRMVGFNATIPHKESLVSMVHRLDPSAGRIGAVNTVLIDNNRELIGYNTDGYGYLTALTQAWGRDPKGATVLMLGAGGAARAILLTLLEAGVSRIVVANRTKARAQALLDGLAVHFPNANTDALYLRMADLPLEQCDLLINCSSVGLHGDAFDGLDLSRLPSGAFVSDIVYRTEPTPLLQQASALNIPCQDGLGMLVHQGAKAYEIWTGKTMPTDIVEPYLRSLNGAE
ncbi:putative shikimate dehydrogenase [Magnetofaba australis IT-1]|uniref:Shikimate dehydrogenase (NADP(+)) n=1 Tax=Magnetofaba australis IT-1 TaxID=1434232 RepID=A0A1Y2JZV8_9PROT|nr:putative shikimate dehydrogenase [Magnetofaba australis IT-1]